MDIGLQVDFPTPKPRRPVNGGNFEHDHEENKEKPEMDSIITSPFTPEQVVALNIYQQSGMGHPYTCGNEHSGDDILVAKTDGWHCPSCNYQQDWATQSMIDTAKMLQKLAK